MRKRVEMAKEKTIRLVFILRLPLHLEGLSGSALVESYLLTQTFVPSCLDNLYGWSVFLITFKIDLLVLVPSLKR